MSTDDSVAVTQTKIANDMLRYLRENQDVCAWLSIHAGHHPYVRWDGEKYAVAETMGYGEIEVQHISGEGLVNTFVNNPIDLMPLDEATDSNGDPLWDRVDDPDDKVEVLG